MNPSHDCVLSLYKGTRACDHDIIRRSLTMAISIRPYPKGTLNHILTGDGSSYRYIPGETRQLSSCLHDIAVIHGLME